jgi:hypothetical protein
MPEIAIFPLRTVLFPDGALPLKIFEQRYLDMTKVCIRDDVPFGVCLIRDGAEVGAGGVPYPVGCTARIAEWDMPHLGLFQLACRGEQVFRIVEHWTLKSGLLRAQVDLMRRRPRYTAGSTSRSPSCWSGSSTSARSAFLLLCNWTMATGRLPAAEVLPLEMEFKQALLEANGPLQRLGMLSEFLRSRSVVV